MRKYLTSMRPKRIVCVFLLFALIAALLSVIIIAIYGASGYAVNLKYAKSAPSYATDVSKTLRLDEEGYYNFTIPDGGELKILNLTDIHIGGGWGSVKNDKNALRAVEALVKYTRPDLITITGDTIFPILWSAGTQNNQKGAALLTELLDSMEVPYAVVFGNHETEGNVTKLNRQELGEYFASREYCLMQLDKTYKDGGGNQVKPYGVGNYVIKVNDQSGKLNTALAFMDSNDYIPGAGGLNWSYDRIHDDQLEWFKQEMAKLPAGTRVLSFFHIPLWEYDEAWKLYLEGSSEVEYHFGWAGESGGKSYPGVENSHLFDIMQDINADVNMPDCVGIFCGHDHYNNYSLTYKGIRLTYGHSIDYLAYADIKYSSFQRGGQLITLKEGTSGLDYEVTPYLFGGMNNMDGIGNYR